MSGTGKSLKSRVWRATQPLVLSAGRWNASQRALPDFLIVGGQRCGTTSLHEWLARHPAVRFPRLGKGVHYFDTAANRSVGWYRSHFPTQSSLQKLVAEHGPTQVGEASPYYLFHPAAPRRVQAVLPDARFIAVLRDPVSRAWSHYQHELRRGHETRDFETAVAAEIDGPPLASATDLERADFVSYEHQHHSYVGRGHYAEQLARWFAVTGPDRWLVLANHELFASDGSGGRKVLEFLGLRPMDLGEFPRENATSGGAMPDAARARLDAEFSDELERLAEVLGRSIRWTR